MLVHQPHTYRLPRLVLSLVCCVWLDGWFALSSSRRENSVTLDKRGLFFLVIFCSFKADVQTSQTTVQLMIPHLANINGLKHKHRTWRLRPFFKMGNKDLEKPSCLPEATPISGVDKGHHTVSFYFTNMISPDCMKICYSSPPRRHTPSRFYQ